MIEPKSYACEELAKWTDRQLLHELLDAIVDALEDGRDTPKLQFEHPLPDGTWRRASLYASVWRISDEEHRRQIEEINKRHQYEI